MRPEIAARIVDEGAKVVWVDGGYDDAVVVLLSTEGHIR
jgi:hypothetical protein